MSQEQDPAKLFPPGFYDKMSRLAAQEHPRLREGAHADFIKSAEPYRQAAERQIALSQLEPLEPEPKQIRRTKKFDRFVGYTLLTAGGSAALFGFAERNINAVLIGAIGAAKGYFETRPRNNAQEEPEVQNTQPDGQQLSVEVRRFQALQALLPGLDLVSEAQPGGGDGN